MKIQGGLNGWAAAVVGEAASPTAPVAAALPAMRVEVGFKASNEPVLSIKAATGHTRMLFYLYNSRTPCLWSAVEAIIRSAAAALGAAAACSEDGLKGATSQVLAGGSYINAI